MLLVTGSQPAPILGRRLFLGRRVVVAQPRGLSAGQGTNGCRRPAVPELAETGECTSARPHLAHRTQLPISAFAQPRRIALERESTTLLPAFACCESIPRSRVDGKRCAMPLWRAPSEGTASYPLSFTLMQRLQAWAWRRGISRSCHLVPLETSW